MLVRIAWIRFAHEDRDIATWIGRIGGVPLVAVDQVLAAVAHDRRLDVRRVTGRDLRFRHRKARPDLPRQQRP